jgi:hypothetical protein
VGVEKQLERDGMDQGHTDEAGVGWRSSCSRPVSAQGEVFQRMTRVGKRAIMKEGSGWPWSLGEGQTSGIALTRRESAICALSPPSNQLSPLPLSPPTLPLSLSSQLLVKDPAERYSLKQVAEHPWIQRGAVYKRQLDAEAAAAAQAQQKHGLSGGAEAGMVPVAQQEGPMRC